MRGKEDKGEGGGKGDKEAGEQRKQRRNPKSRISLHPTTHSPHHALLR
ncbi:hypothetical protein [Chroococcidiopsis cubana]|nr:hypothetical protein [Chroococcidiopsis cubana]